MQLQLFFSSDVNSVELERTSFNNPATGFFRTCYRGKSAESGRATFRWSAAVRCLALLIAKSALCKLKGLDPDFASIEGGKESLAASLDYALSKQPDWMHDMFGASLTGDALLREWIHRDNPGRRRPGPVRLSINTDQFRLGAVQIFVDGEPIVDLSSFESLIAGLEANLDVPSAPTLPREFFASHLPIRSTVIRPAEVADIEQIHEFECSEFPDSHATFKRLLEWRNHDPNNFQVIKYPGEEFLAYYLLLFPRPEAMQSFLGGHLFEDNIESRHLIAPESTSYLACTQAHICVVAWKRGAAFFGMDLYWHLLERITTLASDGVLSEVFAESSTPERQQTLEQFGFKREPDRPGNTEPLFKLTLTPLQIKQWQEYIRTRTMNRPHKSLIAV